jgi:hypothetical protein
MRALLAVVHEHDIKSYECFTSETFISSRPLYFVVCRDAEHLWGKRGKPGRLKTTAYIEHTVEYSYQWCILRT